MKCLVDSRLALEHAQNANYAASGTPEPLIRSDPILAYSVRCLHVAALLLPGALQKGVLERTNCW